MSQVIYKEVSDLDSVNIKLRGFAPDFFPGNPALCSRNPIKTIFFGWRSNNTITDANWDQRIDFNPANTSVALGQKYNADNKTFAEEKNIGGLMLNFGLHSSTRDVGLGGPNDNARRLSCYGGVAGGVFWQGGKLTFTCLCRLVTFRYGPSFRQSAGAFAIHGLQVFSMNL